MKTLLVIAAIVVMSTGSAIPVTPGDNSHYVEGESRYIWMPDGEGVPHLVDLLEPVEPSILNNPERNGANNQYWLFTRSNPNNAQIITHGNTNSIQNSNYQAGRDLKVIVHGWNNNGNSEVNTLITSAFLAVGNVNVIVVDWSRLADSSYLAAATGAVSVGQHLGNFLEWLISTGGGNWNNVHLVGFSLGAHIVGVAGRQVGGRPIRVTGLDPAGPLWGSSGNAININSGVYVEGIHTDGGVLGISNPIGNVDFYPNGGTNPMPGCNGNACSHGRSYEYFASSVRNNHFIGRQCANINQALNNQCTGGTLNMGNSILSKRGNGMYGLTTSNNWPF